MLPTYLNGLLGLRYYTNRGQLYQNVTTKYYQRYHETIEVSQESTIYLYLIGYTACIFYSTSSH